MRTTIPLYQAIARALRALLNCEDNASRATDPGQQEHWREMRTAHAQRIVKMCREHLPSGSGIDNGAKLLEDSNPNRLRFSSDFHHMDGNGFYDGWTEHIVTIRPSLEWGIDISISGPNRNGIKDYLSEVWRDALTAPAA